MGRRKKIVEENLSKPVHKKETLKEKKARFLVVLKEEKGNITHSAERFGISRDAYYKWYYTDPEFAIAADDIINEVIDWVESKLFKLIEQNNRQAIIFYLKTRAKKRGYIEKTEVDLGINEEKNTIIIKRYDEKDKGKKE